MSVCKDDNDKNDIHYLTKIRHDVKEKAKAPTQKEIQQGQKQRNLRIKDFLRAEKDEQSSSNLKTPTLYEVRVTIDKELRLSVNMKKEKGGRMFLPIGDSGCRTLDGLENTIFYFFPALRNNSFSLSANFPDRGHDRVNDNGSSSDPCDESTSTFTSTSWEVRSDEDVIQTFNKSINFFSSFDEDESRSARSASSIHEGSIKRQTLKRPTILLHIMKHMSDENSSSSHAPTYLERMANPKATTTMTMLSFYSFPAGGIPDPEDFTLFLKKIWEPFDALGRVYVAKEGINAQMSVPTNVLCNFEKCCSLIPEMGKYVENGINIDPKPLTVEEFSIAGNIDGKSCPPFKQLLLKLRPKIVADGLGEKALHWDSAGYDMPPLEWHHKLKEVRQKRERGFESVSLGKDIGIGNSSTCTRTPLIFDCRNHYETSVGIFEGAEPLNTENFRDSWNALEDKLKDTPKDAPIMTYCTGGIRCVKVGAYLTQEMGFTNVSRLAGGIIAYDRTLNEKNQEEEPMFKGTNYVFDGRVGREITQDLLGICITCEGKTNLLSNCKNVDCHKRIVQCDKCVDSFLGCCSEKCKEVFLRGSAPNEIPSSTSS